MKYSSVTATQEMRAGYRVASLFGLLFFAVGAGFLLFSVVPNLWDALRMRDWVQVPAKVVAVDLETNDSGDSTTYKVTARFEYDYNGHRYSGHRVGSADGERFYMLEEIGEREEIVVVLNWLEELLRLLPVD